MFNPAALYIIAITRSFFKGGIGVRELCQASGSWVAIPFLRMVPRMWTVGCSRSPEIPSVLLMIGIMPTLSTGCISPEDIMAHLMALKMSVDVAAGAKVPDPIHFWQNGSGKAPKTESSGSEDA